MTTTVNTHSPALDFGQQCLRTFTHFIPASLAAFYRIDEQLQACDFQLLGMSAPMHSTYLEHYRHLDPLQPAVCLAHDSPIIALEDGMRLQSSAHNRQYQDFLQRNAVVDVVEIIVHVDATPVAGISLLRQRNLGAFRPQELQSLLPLQGLMQQGASLLRSTPSSRLTQLTPRERQIALLLRSGASNKAVARELGLGLATVKTHLLNLFRKVGVGSRTELVANLFIEP